MATTASKYQPGSRGPLRRTVDRRGVDGAAPPRIWSASWRVMGCPAKCRRARATASVLRPDAEAVHDRLDVDVLNLNVRADLGHTPITNHQSPIMRRTRAGVYFRSTSSCSHHGRHHQT